MEIPDHRESCLKELPTKELKFKRNKVWLNSPTIPPIRLRVKNNTSPLSSETDNEKCFSDRSISSSPDSVSHDLSTVFISSSYTRECYRISSPPSSPMANKSNTDFCESVHIETSNYEIENEDYDQPLDMSKKRFQDVSASTETHILNNHHHHQLQQHRPSVITCASALLKTPCNITDEAHYNCSPNVSDCSSDDPGDNSCETPVQHTNENSSDEVEAIRPGHRREIVSGSCDPVIDEHFRRSLGKDYQQIFSKSTANSVSVTVDDHFAKALGDTWHQLQQSKSVFSEPVSSSHAKNSLQPPPPPQFIHQPPEIFS